MSTEWLNGPRLVKWLRSHGLTAMDSQIGSYARRVRDWERGAIASVYTVDAVLVRIGRHLSEIPDGLYCEAPDRSPNAPEEVHGKRYPEDFKSTAVSRALGGESYRSLAAELGCSHATIGKWVQRMNAEREALPVVDGGYR